MGMVLEGKIVSAAQAQAIQANPDLIEALVYGDDDEEFDEELLDLDDPSVLDIDKSWHGLHFLLTGSDWDASEPLGLAILGGQPVGEDNGYGPARLLEPEQVQVIAGALVAVDTDTLRARYDPAEFERHEIYPTGIWDEQDTLDEYLMPNLEQLIAFYVTAASTKSAVILAIT